MKELGTGSSGRASGFPMLEKLVLQLLPMLESLAGPSNNGVWNEQILSKVCPRFENISLPSFEKISYSHGEATQFEYIIWRIKFGGNNNLGREQQETVPPKLLQRSRELKPRWH